MEFFVNIKLEGKTIIQLLEHYNVSVRTSKKLKEEKRIYVNQLIKPLGYVLSMGDVVFIDFAMEECNVQPEEDVLEHYYEDDLYLVVDKPVGMKCGGYRFHETGTVANCIAGYYKKIHHHAPIRFAKNEDVDVSGLLIVSKSSYAQSQMEDKSANAKRTYRCLVEGRVKEKGNRIIQLGVVRDGENRKRIVSKTGLQAVTKYEVIDYIGNMTLIECQPINEVTHQIRVHLSAIGHPIVGDKVYGGLDLGDKMYFECIKIDMYNRYTNKNITIEKDPTY